MAREYAIGNDCEANEKRQYNRFCANFSIRVFDKKSNRVLGDVSDINLDGMKLISSSPIPTQKTFSVWMNITMNDNYKDQLDFETRSIWSRADANPGMYETGFINTLSLQDLDKIQNLINLITSVEEPLSSS